VKLKQGSVLNDRFEVLAELGEGGFGTVYKAHDRLLNREVALKQLKNCAFAGEEDIKRFMRESQILSRLKHPNIVSVYAFEAIEGQPPLMVMEFVDGKSLKALLQENPDGLPFSLCKRLFLQICEAVSCAHGEAMIHRDLSPANILIVKNAETELNARVIDFGLSKLLRQEQSQAGENAGGKLTKTGSLLGNPAYMSPEACIGGEVDEQSDIYSLGCLLYEMLTGRALFEGAESIGLLYKQLNEYPAEPGLSWESKEQEELFKSVCLLCLQKEKQNRAQSAALVVSLLRQEKPVKPLLKSIKSWQGKPAKAKSFSIRIAAPAAVALSLLVGTLAFSILSKSNIKEAEGSLNQNDTDQKLSSLVRRLQQKVSRYGDDSPELIRPYLELSNYCYSGAGRNENRAINYLEKLLQLMNKYPTSRRFSRLNKLDVLRMLANCYEAKGDINKARQEVDAALEIVNLEKDGGGSAENYVYWLRRLAWIYFNQGNDAKAEALFKKCMALAENSDHVTELETALSIGQYYMTKNRPAKALPYMERARKLAAEIYEVGKNPMASDGTSRATYLGTFREFAQVKEKLGEFVEAESIDLEGLSACRIAKYLPESEIWQLQFLEHAACCRQARGQYSQARKACDEARQILQTEFSQQKSLNAMMQYRFLAYTYWGCGDFSKAVDLMSRALEISRELNGADTEISRVVMDELAFSYMRVKDPRAETLYREILSHGSDPYPHERWRCVNVKEKLARCWMKSGKFDEARNLLEEASQEAQKQKPPVLFPEGKLELAEIYLRDKRIDKAESFFRQSMDEGIKLGDKAIITKVATTASDYYIGKSDYSSAQKTLLKALESLKDSSPADDTLSISLLRSLAKCYDKQGLKSEAQKYTCKAQELAASSKAEPFPAGFN
jgi:serine/threonine protein kinase